MADRNCEEDQGWLNAGHDERDRELDAALAKYAAVEPRAGLEERVLANLRSEQSRAPHRAWWHWGLAGAAAAVVVVALALAWRLGKPSAPVIADHPSTSPTNATQRPQQQLVANREGNKIRPREHSSIRTASTHPSHAEVAAANPKLGQFPSPEPLSEQEKILQNYVAKYPEQAVLIARAASEAQRRDQLEEMQAFASGEPAADSQEPNNQTTER